MAEVMTSIISHNKHQTLIIDTVINKSQV